MGCDIHTFVERRFEGEWRSLRSKFTQGNSPFDWRSYGIYGFLADVRNYSKIPPIAELRGLPDDVSESTAEEYDGWTQMGCHPASWLSLAELLAADYDQEFFDDRRQETTTIKEFLGPSFFHDLDVLKTLGPPEDVRVVFWFDN
jgi:hypothetical protein